MISFFLTEYAGEHVIDLENPAHKQLWKDAKSSPNFVAREIGEVAGKHKDENGDDVFIDPAGRALMMYFATIKYPEDPHNRSYQVGFLTMFDEFNKF